MLRWARIEAYILVDVTTLLYYCYLLYITFAAMNGVLSNTIIVMFYYFIYINNNKIYK